MQGAVDGGATEPTLAARRVAEGSPATSRSFRMHRPRGPFCASGSCQRCPVRTRAGTTELACEIPATHGAPVRVDPRRAIARRAESLTPWFYERRFLRPRFLRRAYLEAIRRLSAAPALPSRPPAAPRPALSELRTDALVVGAGPAGIAAAVELSRRGHDVLLVERDGRIGGSARWRAMSLDEVPDEVRILTGSTCIGIYARGDLAAIVTPEGPLEVRLERLVVATGAYDRPLAYEGNDLPGTIGVRAFERFAAQATFAPHVRIGLVAGPEEADRAAEAAARHGMRLTWATGPSKLDPAIADEVMSDRVVRASGRRRIRSVELEVAGGRDTNVLIVGFSQPAFELSIQSGGAATLAGSPRVIVPGPRAGALVVGEAAGAVRSPAAGIGERVARWLEADDPGPASAPPELPSAAHAGPEAVVCFCEDVRVRDIEGAVAEGFGDAELVKRRTGAGTGPCQGAYCLGEVVATLERTGVAPSVPTVRPPMHPIRLADLAVADD